MIAGLIRGRANFRQYATAPIAALPLTAASPADGNPLAAASASPLTGAALRSPPASSAVLGFAGGGVLAAQRAGDKVTSARRLADVEPRRAEPSGASTRASSALARLQGAGQDETKHFKLIGTTGTGKSTAIQELIRGALARGDRAVIADPDGGYLRRFYREERGDVILNPFDQRSVKWDLFAEIKTCL